MSDPHTYTYSKENDFPTMGIDPAKLAREIQASGIGGLSSVVVSDDEVLVTFSAELAPADKTILDGDTFSPAGGIIEAHSCLLEYKKLRMAVIDVRTHELIDGGYEYDSETFSCSENAQRKMTILSEDADNITFPIDVARRDGHLPPYSVADKVTLLSMLSFMRAHIQTQLYSGEDLKDQIRAATDTAGVDAVEDTR